MLHNGHRPPVCPACPDQLCVTCSSNELCTKCKPRYRPAQRQAGKNGRCIAGLTIYVRLACPLPSMCMALTTSIKLGARQTLSLDHDENARADLILVCKLFLPFCRSLSLARSLSSLSLSLTSIDGLSRCLSDFGWLQPHKGVHEFNRETCAERRQARLMAARGRCQQTFALPHRISMI